MGLLAHRPKAVAFDVNETLFSLETMRPRLCALGLPPLALEWWFAVVLRDGFALAAAGDARPFRVLAGQALVEILEASGSTVPPGTVGTVLAGLSELAPHPDVEPGLSMLAGAGVPALALTNGSAGSVTGLLARAALGDLLPRVVSVEEVGLWKPRPEPYHYAAGQAGAPPEALALVASHPWDIHGAARAGLVTGWVNRGGRSFPAGLHVPHVQGQTLDAVVERLLALPDR